MRSLIRVTVTKLGRCINESPLKLSGYPSFSSHFTGLHKTDQIPEQGPFAVLVQASQP